MKIVLDPAVPEHSPDAERQATGQAHRTRWERVRQNLQLLACGAALVWLAEWMAGGRGGHFVAQDVTMLFSLLWGLTFLAQKASEPSGDQRGHHG